MKQAAVNHSHNDDRGLRPSARSVLVGLAWLAGAVSAAALVFAYALTNWFQWGSRPPSDPVFDHGVLLYVALPATVVCLGSIAVAQANRRKDPCRSLR